MSFCKSVAIAAIVKVMAYYSIGHACRKLVHGPLQESTHRAYECVLEVKVFPAVEKASP